MCLCIYVCVRTSVCVSVYESTYVCRVCVYAYTYVCVRVSVSVCMKVRTYVGMCLCIYVCVCTSVCVRLPMCTSVCICVYVVYAYTYACERLSVGNAYGLGNKGL